MGNEPAAPGAVSAPATIADAYRAALDALADLEATRLRLLGRADVYRALIDAGHGALPLPEPTPTDTPVHQEE